MFFIILRKLIVIGPETNEKIDPKGHYPPSTNTFGEIKDLKVFVTFTILLNNYFGSQLTKV